MHNFNNAKLYVKLLDVNSDYVTKESSGVFNKQQISIVEFFDGKIRYIKETDKSCSKTIIKIDKNFIRKKIDWDLANYDEKYLASILVVPVIDTNENFVGSSIEITDKDIIIKLNNQICLQKIYFPTAKQWLNLTVLDSIDLAWMED